MTPLRQRMLDDLRRRNYTPDTIRAYIRAVRQFAEFFGRSPEQMGAEDVRRYQIYLLHEKKLAPGSVENCVSALRFLYKRTLKRRDLAFDDLPFPKQPRILPNVLSQDEVRRLIEGTRNRMHRTILMLLYATGVRRTEASRIKVSDIDSGRMVIHIRRGNGLRDRDVPLTPKLLEELLAKNQGHIASGVLQQLLARNTGLGAKLQTLHQVNERTASHLGRGCAS